MTGPTTVRHTPKSIFLFWLPLAATWLMMAIEGPFLAAVIARLASPEFNLAAYGVAYAFALLAEAPVIMLLSAATALIDDGPSFRKLRGFTYGLIAAVTLGMLLILVPPVYEVIAVDLISLPAEVASRTYTALWLLLPWPGAIGFRRFYQGLMIRDGRPRLVAYGTVLRLTAMASVALVLFLGFDWPGAHVGAAALSAGVCAEALASRWMAVPSIRRFADAPAAADVVLGYSGILRFYYPLALTSLIGLAVQPLLTFFMGRAPAPVESLAVFPVVNSLGFLFRSLGLSYQEVAIALMGRRHEHAREMGRFAVILGLASSAGLALVALTPLADFWYGTVSGLSPELVAVAITPTILFIPLPFMSVLLSYQRGILVVGHRTRPLTWATVLEVGGIALLFPVLGWQLGLIGVTAAVGAFFIGRLAGNLYLIRPCVRMLRSATAPRPGDPERPEPTDSPRSDVA
jgi:hypothetical protein